LAGVPANDRPWKAGLEVRAYWQALQRSAYLTCWLRAGQ
jgi:hypothetical protein